MTKGERRRGESGGVKGQAEIVEKGVKEWWGGEEEGRNTGRNVHMFAASEDLKQNRLCLKTIIHPYKQKPDWTSETIVCLCWTGITHQQTQANEKQNYLFPLVTKRKVT